MRKIKSSFVWSRFFQIQSIHLAIVLLAFVSATILQFPVILLLRTYGTTDPTMGIGTMIIFIYLFFSVSTALEILFYKKYYIKMASPRHWSDLIITRVIIISFVVWAIFGFLVTGGMFPTKPKPIY